MILFFSLQPLSFASRSSALPAQLARPCSKPPDLLFFQQQIDCVIVSCQVLVAAPVVDEAMTGTAEPCYVLQVLLLVPASFDGFVVHEPGDEVVIG